MSKFRLSTYIKEEEKNLDKNDKIETNYLQILADGINLLNEFTFSVPNVISCCETFRDFAQLLEMSNSHEMSCRMDFFFDLHNQIC